ncbi:Cell-division-associated, ABC-transporter-like signaling protein FtsX [hydrothermal vent metagenome]|uniref:Cell division protein FtsX n=1 Tax=hydrothermal vent metagenome TaxID=652676 RepID=A0A3B0QTR5_9ZZZZ
MIRGAALIYTVIDGLRGLKENFVTTILSSLTVAFALAIFSLFIIVFVNLNSFVEGMGDRTHIVAYVKDGALSTKKDSTGKGAAKVKASIEALSGVSSVEYISKKEAFAILKGEMKDNLALLEGVSPDILPASFEIKLAADRITPKDIRLVVESLKGQPWVEDIQHGTEWAERFGAILGFMEAAAIFLGLFLGAATIFIISNTIRLAVYARRDEIEIMRYLGAPTIYIKTPFLIEGIAEGVIGGAVAMAALFLGDLVLGIYIPPDLVFILDNPFSPLLLFILLILGGLVLGVVGSIFSLGRFLKV